ncbi:hypothetical protein [Novosphingobium beihaiensis]|uniref:Uncharacterized protein n=1 Tax=Novosphingobium beihaiensis TaxID=2930389 RepID=A0ABT0BLW0_9SPHN|nr:hypothetical protein [Novosphingobium beihaiensis]MCJ2186037.1 hypothetical protein [Novosphingobium beihaiensis]
MTPFEYFKAVRPIIVLAPVMLLASCQGGSETAASHGEDTDTKFCEVIADYVSPADCSDFEKQASRQMPGKAAFNAPFPLKRGETFTVWLAVAATPPKGRPNAASTPARTDGEAGNGAADGAVPPQPAETAAEEYIAPDPAEIAARMAGRPEFFSVVVGDYVAASLQGDESFEIKPASGRIQRVKLGPPWPSSIWKWDITAKRGGYHTMTLSTAVQVKDRKGYFHEIESTPRAFAFDVAVSPIDKARDVLTDAPVWMKLLAAVFTAAAALLVTIKKFRDALFSLFRRQDGTPPDNGPDA